MTATVEAEVFENTESVQIPKASCQINTREHKIIKKSKTKHNF